MYRNTGESRDEKTSNINQDVHLLKVKTFAVARERRCPPS